MTGDLVLVSPGVYRESVRVGTDGIVIRGVDRNLPPPAIRTLAEKVDATLGQERLLAVFSSVFGALALGLAAVGLYGVVAYTVARRTAEFGVRLALGATPGAVLRLVLKGTLTIVGAGLAAGLPASLAAGRLISSQLYGLSATDPTTLVLAASVLLAVATCAGYVPARGAARVDPVEALRHGGGAAP